MDGACWGSVMNSANRVRLRPEVAAMQGYVPGQQPPDSGWTKLNTNESSAVAPGVLKALREAVTIDLRLYPDPTSRPLRERLADRHQVEPESIIVTNGSDDALNLIVRAVCGPGDRVVAPQPSYSLYPVLAEIQGADMVLCALGEQFELPIRQLASARGAVTFVSSPNNPAGTQYAADDLSWLAERTNLLVIDEAYVEFATDDRVALARELPNVCITRSFSKAFGLAGVRLGYAVGHPALIDALHRVKDSYNVGRLAQVAGLAALDEIVWAENHWEATRVRRDKFAEELYGSFGLHVYPSEANFVFVECGDLDAGDIQDKLSARRILVRRFAEDPLFANALRISIGSEQEMLTLMDVLLDIL